MNSDGSFPDSLREAARDVALNAHVPHSGFRVGCAYMLEDGAVVRGCNVESDSYGLTNCAERVAIGAGIAYGWLNSLNRIRYMAIVCLDAPDDAPVSLIASCGACRQVMSEHMAAEHQIRFIGHPHDWTIEELLPNPFKLS